jgi:hypothetical protein
MKIAILSDTHTNLENVEEALVEIDAEGIETILHCGDVGSVEIVEALTPFDVWIAQGNVDRQRQLAQTARERLGRGRFSRLHRLTLDGYTAALTHGDDEEALANLVASGAFAFVFHGHTHRRRDEIVGRTRVINPGAMGGTRRERRSFGILDLSSGKLRTCTVHQ